jgi:hypothetical protein
LILLALLAFILLKRCLLAFFSLLVVVEESLVELADALPESVCATVIGADIAVKIQVRTKRLLNEFDLMKNSPFFQVFAKMLLPQMSPAS